MDREGKISTIVNPLDPASTPMIDDKGNKNNDRPPLSIPHTLEVKDLIEYIWTSGANVRQSFGTDLRDQDPTKHIEIILKVPISNQELH